MKVFALIRLCINGLLMLFLSQSALAFHDHDPFDPNDLLASYTENSNLTQSFDHGIMINIYRNGDTFVSIPETMKNAGYYRAVLAQEKLDALWLLLTNEKVLAFDAQAVRRMQIRKQRLSKESRAVVTSVSDKTACLLRFYPNRYRPQGLAGKDADIMKRIQWSGSRWDAEHYPGIEQIQLFAKIQTIILSILNQDNLQSIDKINNSRD